jgi:hypothetical protein
MCFFDISVCNFTVSSGHFQTIVTKQSLQTKKIAAVSKERDSGSMTKRMGRAAHAN